MLTVPPVTPNTLPRLWLIGGTEESKHLALAIAQAHIPCTVTVTTEAARALYPADSTVRVWVGQLTSEILPQFLQQQHIAAILDASHPFAVEISRGAIAAAQPCCLPYLRYERTAIIQHRGTTHTLPSLEALLTPERLQGQRLLAILGYRMLAQFQPWQHQATLFARILPSPTALEAALAAGFTPDRLIALRPPVCPDLERALWQQWQISLVVAKASGSAGGEDVKRQVAADLGIPLVIIERPGVAYPAQTDDIQIALTFCLDHMAPALGSPPR